MESHLFRDTVLICGDQGACLLRHDGALAGFEEGSWKTSLLRFADGKVVEMNGEDNFSLPRGAGSGKWVCGTSAATAAAASSSTATSSSFFEQLCTSWSDALPEFGCAADGSDCALVRFLCVFLMCVLLEEDNILYWLFQKSYFFNCLATPTPTSLLFTSLSRKPAISFFFSCVRLLPSATPMEMWWTPTSTSLPRRWLLSSPQQSWPLQ
jgi:hypothetical protein